LCNFLHLDVQGKIQHFFHVQATCLQNIREHEFNPFSAQKLVEAAYSAEEHYAYKEKFENK
jgi:hypothetical protein